jgi:hypothetical protein
MDVVCSSAMLLSTRRKNAVSKDRTWDRIFWLFEPWNESILYYTDIYFVPYILIFKEDINELLHLEHSIVWCWNLGNSESRSEISEKFPNVVLEKDGDQLDWWCEKWGKYYGVKEERNILHTIKRKKADWIGHILRRKCLLKHIIEGKIEGGKSDGRTRKKT